MTMLRGYDNLLIVILACRLGEIGTAILSRNKAIKSSSTFANWVPSRAVDGSTRTDADACQCCSATTNDLNTWYELDLGKSYRIHTIDVIGRDNWDYYNSHFQDMQVMFGQVSIDGLQDSPETTITERVGSVTYVVPVPTYTRYISLVLRDVTRPFIICELIVYGDCDDGEYGAYCENRCHYCDGDPCDKVTGICPSGKCFPGYSGDKCDNECQDGMYGPGCTQQCGNCLNNAVCDTTFGNCPGRCSAGYQGAICKQDCDDGTYGDGCQIKCGFCVNGTSCNKVSGLCEQGCSPGYKGSYCYQPCSDGFYGDRCERPCGNCKDDTVCNKVHGFCETGCVTGYKRQLCIEACDDGTYGESCVSQCGRCYNDTVCDKMSGYCSGCAAGFKEDNCDVEESPCGMASCSVPVGVAIGGTACTILLIGAFVGAIVYIVRKRRQVHADKRSPEEVNPYGMPDRELFTSEHHYELKQRSVTTT